MLKRVLAGVIFAVVAASGTAAWSFVNADASYLPADFPTGPTFLARPNEEGTGAILLAAAPPGEGDEEYNLSVKFNDGGGATKPGAVAKQVAEPDAVAEVPASGDLSLSGDDRWVAIASVEDVNQAIEIARPYSEQKARVVKARNGFFAVVLGPYATSNVSTFRKSYAGPDLPAKILLTRGTDYMATMWPATADTPKLDPLAQSAAGTAVDQSAAEPATEQSAADTVAEPSDQPSLTSPSPKAVDETVVAAFAEQLENSATSSPQSQATDQLASAAPVNDPDVAYDRGDYATALKLWKQNDAPPTSEEPAADNPSSENLALSGDDRWVAIASVEDAEAAIVIARAFSEQKSRVVRARNGWFAVVLGPTQKNDISAFRKAYSGPELPPGILLTRGTDYMATVWPAPAGTPAPVATSVVAPVDETAPVEAAAPVDATVAADATAPADAAMPVDAAATAEVPKAVDASLAPAENQTATIAPFRPIAELEPLAEQGDATAQENLGAAYVKGEGVPQDYVLAHMWFNLAAALGNEDARTNRDAVAKVMTPDQVAEAQRLARQWKPVVTAQ